MEPRRMLVVSSVPTRQGTVREGEYVWMFEESAERGTALIEVRDQRMEVPSAALIATPVPAPMEKLKALDDCFGREPDVFREVYVNQEWLFRVLECEHGNLFLEDTVTGVGWYTRLLFMGDVPREPDAFLEFWRRHRRLSNDQIHLRAIGL